MWHLLLEVPADPAFVAATVGAEPPDLLALLCHKTSFMVLWLGKNDARASH
jgi:hypothetical protein